MLACTSKKCGLANTQGGITMVTRCVLLLLILILAGCNSSDTGRQADEAEQTDRLPVVYVSNYLLEYFAQRIAGPVVEIRFPAATSSDPAYWSPAPGDITEMQTSGLIVLNGASYEQWIKNVSLPTSRIVVTAKGFKDEWIPLEEAISHSHGQEGEHEHGDTAFTTWLDVKLAVEQGRALRDSLISRWPDNTSHFEDNYEKLEADLLKIDSEFETVVGRAPDTPVIFSHPVYQYFERRYGVRGISIHWEPDQLPDENMWSEIKEIQSIHKARWMLWEAEPLAELVRRLEGLGIQSAVLNPCGNKPETGDFLEVMVQNIEALNRVYPE